MMNCDALLLLGTDFPYRQFYPEKAKIIQVDNRSENIGRRTHVDYGLIGDVKETIKCFNPEARNKKRAKVFRCRFRKL